MILYLPGNLLKAARALELGKVQFCPPTTEEMASIDCSEENIRTLFDSKIEFILELEKREELPPVYVALKPHQLNAVLGIPWFVPSYFKYPKPKYDAEFRWHGAPKTDAREYKSNMAMSQFEKLSEHADISRVYSVHGLTPAFLERFNLKLVVKEKFKYAIPKRQV